MKYDAIKQIIDNNKYMILNPNNYHKGHGNSLSIKVVMPTYCQANCEFCFNKNKVTQKYDIEQFKQNIDITLSKIFSKVNRIFTIDITGSEPTFNVELLKDTLQIINKYKSYISQIVITTNGFNLKKCLSFIDMVDIINISVHHYDYNKRTEIFGTNNILNDNALKEVISELTKKDIKVTAIAVLDKEMDDFIIFYNNFTDWALNMGFQESRIRSNYLRDDKFIADVFNADIGVVVEESDVPGLKSKKVYDGKRNYYTYIYKGIETLVNTVIGAELVIDDDGLLYIDYEKKYPVSDKSLGYFNRIYVLGNKVNEKCFE